MSKQIEALKLALEAFEADASNENFLVLKHCVREALAENALDRMAENERELGLDYMEPGQPAQREPVAYLTEDGDRVVTAKTYNSAKKDGGAMWSTMRPFCVPLYTSPPTSKPWVGLTDEEFQWIYDHGRTPAGMMELAEDKLREKNA